MNPYVARRSPRGAFTLVELLMVVVVIGILAGLGTAAFIAARGAAINARMTGEIAQLDQGIEKYRQDHGEYFPNPQTSSSLETDAQRQQRIMLHIRKAFPRYFGDYNQFAHDVGEATYAGGFTGPSRQGERGLNVDYLDAAEALVFFLGGLPNKATETPLTGFASDPQRPFQPETIDPSATSNPPAAASARTPQLFNFNTGRLVDLDQDGWYEYVPDVDVSSGQAPPYVYFDNRSYAKGAHYPAVASLTSDKGYDPSGPALGLVDQFSWGIATPYVAKSSPVVAFVEPKKYQILCAGRDGKYSGMSYTPGKEFPTTMNFALEDNDNLSNFTTGTLESAKP